MEILKRKRTLDPLASAAATIEACTNFASSEAPPSSTALASCWEIDCVAEAGVSRDGTDAPLEVVPLRSPMRTIAREKKDVPWQNNESHNENKKLKT